MADKNARFLADEVFPIALGGALGMMDVARQRGCTLQTQAVKILPPRIVEMLFRPADREQQITRLMDIITVAFAAVAELKALDRRK